MANKEPVQKNAAALFSSALEKMYFLMDGIRGGHIKETSVGEFVDDVVGELQKAASLFRSATNKSMTMDEFGVHAAAEIAKAKEEGPEVCRPRLKVLSEAIEIAKSAFTEENNSVDIPVYEAPKVEEPKTEEPKADTKKADDAPADPPKSAEPETSDQIADLDKRLDSLKKDTKKSADDDDVGWPLDMASPAFLKGEPEEPEASSWD
jgi:hypothetical protein